MRQVEGGKERTRYGRDDLEGRAHPDEDQDAPLAEPADVVQPSVRVGCETGGSERISLSDLLLLSATVAHLARLSRPSLFRRKDAAGAGSQPNALSLIKTQLTVLTQAANSPADEERCQKHPTIDEGRKVAADNVGGDRL